MEVTIIKKNEHSFCHDCGTKIPGEEFYCNECLEKNGLNKFNIIALIFSLLQPLLGLFIMILYRKPLNPGIYRAAFTGLIINIVVCVIMFIYGFFSALVPA